MKQSTVFWLRLAERAIPITLPVLVALAGGIWALYNYMGQQERLAMERRFEDDRQTRARLIEAQRPFLTQQLALYFETSQLVGKIITQPPKTDEWSKLENRFWALYWSELAMVEHPVVESAMKNFGDQLATFRNDPSEAQRRILERRAYELAHAIRSGIVSAWGPTTQPAQ
jgi:hypothetical protein